jgi:hypothetical protein
MDCWKRTTADGERVAYCYEQSEVGCWATRKIGDIVDSLSPVPRGLNRRQVEQLFS